MKITFLGSSHGVPEPDRKCSCIMVEVGEKVYFVDMGAPAIDALRTKGIPVENVQGVFITHMHGDHTNGLIHFADLISWYYTSADPEIYLPLLDGAKIISDWIGLSCHAVRELRYRQVTEGAIYDDGVLKVTAINTKHTASSYAYRIEADGKSVVFTGDMHHPSVDFPAALARHADLVICEGAHFAATEYKSVLEQHDPKRVIVNHYAPWNVPHIMTLQKELPHLCVTMAHDGMEITL